MTVAGLPGPLRGLSLDLGNPHVVVALPDEAELELRRPDPLPVVDAGPPHGTNVELVVPLGPGHIRMRVHERVGNGIPNKIPNGMIRTIAKIIRAGIDKATASLNNAGRKTDEQ